jgi:glycosyltransferase involved in cell wall biosynthesis
VRRDLLDIGVSDQKIRVIPNGVDLEEFSPGPPQRERFALPPDVPLGLFVGDLRTPRKNLDTVLKAMRLVPSFHLAVAGTIDGSPYPAMAREMDIDGRVHFLGYCKDIPALMRSADVCLCPSRYEPFSLVLLESLASGCPVITARSVGAAELLSDDAGWILEDPDDVEALASSLAAIVDPSAPILEMRDAARAIAEAHSFDNMAQSYLHLIENASLL